MDTIKVLDHGFVKLRNLAGPTRRHWEDLPEIEGNGETHESDMRQFDASDVDPAQAARMSFDQMDSTRTYEQDIRLAEYLMKNKHTSPFEMVQVWLEMKLPIFVARQFVRHRTVRLNEVSGRYVTLPAEWYIPANVGAKATDKKQGQTDGLDPKVEAWFKEKLNAHCDTAYFDYLVAIDDGVAPEHARMLLHLNHYTHWLWNQDLHNLMHFLSLRDHGHAQIEAQMYAKAIDLLIRSQLPETMKLYDKYRRM